MLFIPYVVISAAASQLASQSRQPTTSLPFKTPEEMKRDVWDDRIAKCLLWASIIVPGVIFTAVWGTFFFAVIKFAFAAQGQKFP